MPVPAKYNKASSIAVGLVSLFAVAALVRGNADAVTPYSPAPQITNVTPDSGPAGTSVTLLGTAFDQGQNLILFGNSTGAHHPDGSPDNARATAASPDGTTLTFTIPGSGPGGILCDANNRCVGIAAILLSPGPYKIAVMNANGTSNALTFNLIK